MEIKAKDIATRKYTLSSVEMAKMEMKPTAFSAIMSSDTTRSAKLGPVANRINISKKPIE